MTAQEKSTIIITKDEISTSSPSPDTFIRQWDEKELETFPAALQSKAARIFYEWLRLQDLKKSLEKKLSALDDTADEDERQKIVADLESVNTSLMEAIKVSIKLSKKQKRQVCLLYALDYGKQMGKLDLFTEDEKVVYKKLVGDMSAKMCSIIYTDGNAADIKDELEKIFSFLVNADGEKVMYHANVADCKNLRNSFIKMRRKGKKVINNGFVTFEPLTTSQAQQCIEYILAMKIASKPIKSEYLEI